MKLVNIANQGRSIFLFTRQEDYTLTIKKVDNFYPFYYEPDDSGDYKAYDGTKLMKIIVNEPYEISKMKSPTSYGSDIKFVNNYLVHEVPKLEQTSIKYFFLDIEIMTSDLPDVKLAKLPVSCVTIYNSESKEYKTFFLGDYEGTIKQKESRLLGDLLDYFKQEKPDIWLSWNVDFDYIYLHQRIKHFAKEISPINSSRNSREKDIYYPDGISILDYLTMFKKVNMRENSYKLDSVAEKYLGKGKKYKEVDFSDISEDLRNRNREDVELLVKLEEKFNIIGYFNEIRLFSKALWEDLTHNSLILDSVVLNEAHRRGIVLGNKFDQNDVEDFELVGAYRRSDPGIFFDIYKADVASMYPNQLVNFCLDPVNIVPENEDSERLDSYDMVSIEGTKFYQNKDAILPYLAIKLMSIKDDLKKQLKQTKINSEESKILQMKYDAYKGLVNSLFGVTAFPSFRLYNNKVASAITFLARDLLHYTEDFMIGNGYKVIAVDTDALMYSAEEDKIDLLNDLVQQWAKKYNKESVDIKFESEGKFTKLLILGRCHYYGYIDTGKGIKREIKGVEVKRSSSSKYESYFQENLIEKILNKEAKEKIIAWVESEKIRIKTLPLEEISFPCKLTNKQYKVMPIFKRAYENTKNLIKDFKVSLGENFFYIYIKSIGFDSSSKDINVLAFTNENKKFIDIKRVDWQEIIRRNIDTKADNIFECIGWKEKNKKLSAITLF